jgi:hypothetical protein
MLLRDSDLLTNADPLQKLRLHDVFLPTLGHSSLFCFDSSYTKTVVQSLVSRGCPVGESASSVSNNSNRNGTAAADNLVTIDRLFDASSLAFHDAVAGLWNVPGEYRRAVEFPRSLRWSLTPDLELSDRELGFSVHRQRVLDAAGSDSELRRRMLLASRRGEHRLLPAELDEDYAKAKRESLHKLSLSFSLPAGSSPWMLLRELTKRERFVIDQGMRRSLALRAETQRGAETDAAATRYRIYKKTKRTWKWAGTGVPQGFQTARLWRQLFHIKGARASLIKGPKLWDDVTE